MRLIPGLSEERLLSKIKRFHRTAAVSERALGFYLLDFDSRGLFLKHGCSSTVQFTSLKLQMPPKKTRELLRMARALQHLPLIDESFSKGLLSWSAVRELTRVATGETEKEWLDLALESSSKKIERIVSRAKVGERPPKDPYGLSEIKIKVIAALPLDDYAVWEAAFDRLRTSNGADLDTAKAVVLLAQSFLERPLNREEKEARKAFQVVYHRCSECERAWVQTEDGPEGIAPDKVARREREAMVVRIDERGRNGAGRKETVYPESAKRMNGSQDAPRGPKFLSTPESPKVPAERRDRPNTIRIRQQVISRDGHRCVVPGCGRRGSLYSHHVAWTCHGGRTVLENESCLCRVCHSLVHEVIPLKVNWIFTQKV